MTSLFFSDVKAINFDNYLAIFGQLKTSAPAQKTFDFSNNSTNPAIIITSSQNYERMKQQYQYYPKSKRDLSIYSFDGIRYCKITSKSIKSLNGVTMSYDTPKLLSEIVFPKIDYTSDIETNIYITLDHYNIVQTLNNDLIKEQLLNEDFDQFRENLRNFYELYPKAYINFLISNKQTYLYEYFEDIVDAFYPNFKLIPCEPNTICNNIFELTVGSIVCGHVPLFNGFLLHDSAIHDPIYANTYYSKILDEKDDFLCQTDEVINLTMRSNNIQIHGNGNTNFLIIYKKVLSTNNQANAEATFKIIEQLTSSELLSSESLSNCLFQNELTQKYVKQLIELIEFKNLVQMIEVNNKHKCKEFYITNIEKITNLLFFGIQKFDESQNELINTHVYASSEQLFRLVKQKLNDIHKYYMIEQNSNIQYFDQPKIQQLVRHTNADIKQFTGPILSQMPRATFDDDFTNRHRSCN